VATETPTSTLVITPDALLKHWQGHRALSRRVIEAFPEAELYGHTVGGMRPFSTLAMEMVRMAVPTLNGIVSGEWAFASESGDPPTKAEILKQWDETTAEIDRLWPQIPPARFQEVDTAFGQWKMPIHDLILYVIDNEIHHRGQGYVYLRSLGIEPPPFWERG
jgi:uncharacterized damage-inducible protein DinB